MHYPVPIGRFFLAILTVLLLTACGVDEQTEPTATAPPPTAAPGQMTVRDVIALADSAWPQVTSMRTTSQSSSSDSEDEAFTGSIQDWTSDGDRHIIEFEDGVATNEQIYADGDVYMRGVFVSAAIAPGLDVNTWVVVNTNGIDPDSPILIQVEYLTRAQASPYGSLTEDILNRPVQDGGEVTVGDRTCHLYTFGDETDTGTEIRHEISVDADGLPCQVVQRAGGFVNSTVYEFNTDLTVAAPLAGTPVATPNNATTPTPEG